MKIEVYPDGSLNFEGKTYRCGLGQAGIKQRKQEGDNVTPAGCYPLRQVFYRADKIDKPKTKLKVTAIKPDDGWCDDPTCADYNTLVKLPHKGNVEKLWRDDNLYDIVVPLGYNDDPPVSGKGSAIFMHLPREGYTPTEGCVTLSLPHVLEILAKVDKNTLICFNKE